MSYALQCVQWNRATPYKSAYAPQTYGSRKPEARSPSSVSIYKPNASGALELVVRVSIK